jgi:hypothetical protein
MATNFLIPPLIALAVAGAGLGVCAAFNIAPHVQVMLTAAIVTVVAAELAMIPLVVVRGMTTLEVSLAGLVSTLVHLLVSIGGGLAMMQWAHPQRAFICWLCAFYWTALAGVCRVVVRAIKAAPIPAPNTGRPGIVGSGIERASEA